MNLFGKDATPTTTGTDALREALRVRLKKAHMGSLARDLGIGNATLETFASGGARLSDDVMTKLAKYIFGSNVTFDATANLLRRDPGPSTVVPNISQQFKPPAHLVAPVRNYLDAPYRPASEAPPPPKPRAGWVK